MNSLLKFNQQIINTNKKAYYEMTSAALLSPYPMEEILKIYRFNNDKGFN